MVFSFEVFAEGILELVGAGAIIFLIYYLLTVIKPFLNGYIENEKTKSLSSLDVDFAKKEIAEMVNGYVKDYGFVKFEITDAPRIKNEEIDIMVKEVSKIIFTELSPYYLFLFRIVKRCSTEQDLIRQIHKYVKDQVIDYTAEYNEAK